MTNTGIRGGAYFRVFRVYLLNREYLDMKLGQQIDIIIGNIFRKIIQEEHGSEEWILSRQK